MVLSGLPQSTIREVAMVCDQERGLLVLLGMLNMLFIDTFLVLMSWVMTTLHVCGT